MGVGLYDLVWWRGRRPVLKGFLLPQCSQRSGAPVGPGGGTAKSPGPDGTAKRGPYSS